MIRRQIAIDHFFIPDYFSFSASPTGWPLQPFGNLISRSTESVGAMSVMRWYSDVSPCFIPFPKNRIGTCVSYVYGEPCVVPCIRYDSNHPGSRMITRSPERFG